MVNAAIFSRHYSGIRSRVLHHMIYGVCCLLLVVAVGKKAWKEDLLSPHVLVEASYAHARQLDGGGSFVAVIDEGFDPDHLALKDKFSAYQYHTDHASSDVF